MNTDETCYCGHSADDHGHDPAFPGSSACQVDDCDCESYDHNPDEDVE